MAEQLNKKYELEFKVLSPLHIGAGAEKDWVKGCDFVEKNGKVYKLNLKETTKYIDISVLSEALLKKDGDGLRAKLGGNFDKCIEKCFDMPFQSTNDIKVFIKNGMTNKPVVPGSSLKGAIRSVLLEYLLDKTKIEYYKKTRNFETEIFGSANVGDEFMRFIKISDAAFEKTELINTKIFNLFGENARNLKGGWKHKGGQYGQTNTTFNHAGFNTIYEILRPEEKGACSIAMYDVGFDRVSNHAVKEKKKWLIYGGITKLFEIINSHTKEYIRKEIDFFQKYPNDESVKIINQLQALANQISKDNSNCVLKMSAGSGFHNITGDWQHKEYSIDYIDGNKLNRGKFNGNDSAKSRKIAIDGSNFYMMGFVSLRVRTDEDVQREKQEALELLAIQQRKKDEEAKAIAEQLRLENEQKAKAEQERLAKIAEAKRMEEVHLQNEKEEAEKREAVLKQIEEEARIKREKQVSEGLNFLESCKDFEDAKKKIDQWLQKAKLNVLPVEQHPLLHKALAKFHESVSKKDLSRWSPYESSPIWKKIASWTGSSIALQWYNEIKRS